MSQGSTMTLSDRVKQLTDLSNKRPIIRMNAQKFNDLVKGTPRNYSVIAMFTALSPQRGCAICGAANDEFAIGNIVKCFQSLIVFIGQ